MVYAVQRFWFLRGWQWAGTFASTAVQNTLRVCLIALAALLLTNILNPLLGHPLSRIAGGKTILAMASLWLGASFFAFLAVQSVRGIEWTTNAVARLRSKPADADLSSVDASRRAFFRYAAILAGSAPFAAATYGFAAGRLRYKIERVDVPVANLPKELDGLRIAQLSDIHIGTYMPPHEIARAVGMANELNPDLAVLTGDFVTSEGDPLDTCITELSRLRAPLGVWGCNGNHEIYADVEAEAERLFREKGMRLLRARNAVISHHGASFNLIGVDYQRDHMVAGGPMGPMLQEIEPLVRRDMPNILLSHNPNSFHRAAALGIELSLAGHTHGGQVNVEIVDHNISPARLITPFVAGLYHLPMSELSAIGRQPSGSSQGAEPKPGANSQNGGTGALARVGTGASPVREERSSTVEDSSHTKEDERRDTGGRAEMPAPHKAALYVNRGLGTLGFPVRLGAPPEITLLTLRSA